jgi:geranylgeranyl diphosphate synthase, type II
MMKAFSNASIEHASVDASDFLAACRKSVDRTLESLVPLETTEPKRVHSAMRWSLFAGGKRLRPALSLAVGDAFGARADDLMSAACALEMIHTYSLIHDDLPSMDDDKLRRGRPTCHLQFDEATAILAGDALQTLAFQTIAEDERLAPPIRVQALGELARASGTPYGMIAGQAFDLDAESRDVSKSDLEKIHRHKTGALIRAAARTGAIISEVSGQPLETITKFGEHLGLLFQITDDLLDVTASAEALGKTPGKDARSRKATYPSLYGLEATEDLARKVHDDACRSLDAVTVPIDLLRSIANFILLRRG